MRSLRFQRRHFRCAWIPVIISAAATSFPPPRLTLTIWGQLFCVYQALFSIWFHLRVLWAVIINQALKRPEQGRAISGGQWLRRVPFCSLIITLLCCKHRAVVRGSQRHRRLRFCLATSALQTLPSHTALLFSVGWLDRTNWVGSAVPGIEMVTDIYELRPLLPKKL